MLRWVVRVTGAGEDFVQITLHKVTVLLLNAKRFGTQEEEAASGLLS